MKSKHQIVLWLMAISLFSGCKKEPTEPAFIDLKSAAWRNSIGDTVEVTGYFVQNDDGTGRILFDKDDLSQNGLISEQRYIALGNENIRSLDKQQYYLALVKLKGRVRATSNPGRAVLSSIAGDVSQYELEPLDTPQVLVPSPGLYPVFQSPCLSNPALCTFQSPTITQKYALLYSGGINKDYAYKRYWNDMTLYYTMLVNVYGYEPDNIIVVYKNGVAEDNSMPVDYPATADGINAAITQLKGSMTSTDQFFFFMTNHGGTTADAGSPKTADEDFSKDLVDENGFYYNQSTFPYDEDVAGWVNSLSFSRMICVMEQCFSGGMIYDLRGPNRVIMTAANEVEVSYGGAVYDDFVMLLASALIGTHQVNGTAVKADENGDGKVSLTEAFRWATDNDPHPEHPMYEDNGNGLPTNYPSNTATTTDGKIGKLIFAL